MGQKRRNGRSTTEPSIEDEIAHLRGLDLKGLRARWQSVLQGPAPGHLPRHLLFAIIAYRIQADRFGDLDHETTQLLGRTGAKESGAAIRAAGQLRSEADRTYARDSPGSRVGSTVPAGDGDETVLPGMARPMTAFPRSLLPSPVPTGMAPASLA